jgi:hypothetical protein
MTCRGAARQKLEWFRTGAQTTSVMGQLLQSGCEMGMWRGMRGSVSKKAETCFVLPLREAVAHFARRNTRSTDAKMGCSDNGNAHASIDMAPDFRAGFLPLLSEHGGQFSQQDLGFFAEETIR